VTKNVLIGAGHRNLERGNSFEMELNGRKTRAILDLFDARGGKQALGFDLRCYTPDRGLGMSPLHLNQVPPTGFRDPAWLVDLMVEIHSEGAGPTVRGAFVINPDWGADVDVDVIKYGRVFSDALHANVPNIAVRTINSYGVMSEKRTGVGLQGYRLGVFRDTAQFAERTSRMIFEQGSHDHPTEHAAMIDPGFLAKQADAFLYGCAAWFDLQSPGWSTKPQPALTAAHFPQVAGGDRAWQELIEAGESVTLDGVLLTYDAKKMKARRAAVCRSAPSDSAGQTRGKLTIGEPVSCVFRCKAEGVNWRVTKYGTCIRASALTSVL
jgi:hypothetical protein